MLGAARTAQIAGWQSTPGYVVPGSLSDDASTALLLKFDGNYSDTATSGRTAKTMATLDSPTRIGSPTAKFGTESLSIVASTTTLPRVYTNSALTDFNWWTRDFTIETWANTNSFAEHTFGSGSSAIPKLMGFTASNDYAWSFGWLSSGQMAFWYWNGSGQTVVSTDTFFTTNSWHHIWMDHRLSDGRIRLGADGNIVATGIKSGTPVAGTRFTVGSVRLNAPQFYLDDLRVSHTLRY